MPFLSKSHLPHVFLNVVIKLTNIFSAIDPIPIKCLFLGVEGQSCYSQKFLMHFLKEFLKYHQQYFFQIQFGSIYQFALNITKPIFELQLVTINFLNPQRFRHLFHDQSFNLVLEANDIKMSSHKNTCSTSPQEMLNEVKYCGHCKGTQSKIMMYLIFKAKMQDLLKLQLMGVEN